MEIVDKIKKLTGIKSNYGLAQIMRQRGCEVTTSGVDAYDKKKCKSIRLDVLLTWQEMAADKGVPLETFWSWVKKEAN
jgi:hypothetical protein